MSDETYEVPIMLSPDIHLSYEDIAKLNPFYEKYREFWNTSPDTTETTLSSLDTSSRSPSLQSVHVSTDAPPSPLDISSSPSLHHAEPCAGLHLAAKLDVPLHKGIQRRPSVRVYDEDIAASQQATFVLEGYNNQSLSPVNEATGKCDFHSIERHHFGDSTQQVRSSHKKLFGANGWLGHADDFNTAPLKRQKSKIFRDLGKKIKHHVGEIAEDMAKAYPKAFTGAPRRPRIVPESAIPISLDPPTQARLYSEMEVMICVSANRFLVQQYEAGRISGGRISVRSGHSASTDLVQHPNTALRRRELDQSHSSTFQSSQLESSGEGDECPHLLRPGQCHSETHARHPQAPRHARCTRCYLTCFRTASDEHISLDAATSTDELSSRAKQQHLLRLEQRTHRKLSTHALN